MASNDRRTEAPITATELETDPAAPTSGAGAGDEPRSCAAATAVQKRATARMKAKDLNALTDEAMVEAKERESETKKKNLERETTCCEKRL